MAVLLDEARADFHMTRAAMQALLRLFAALAPIGRYSVTNPSGVKDAEARPPRW
jgi:hypothetical protein